jgi:hypothetical protein
MIPSALKMQPKDHCRIARGPLVFKALHVAGNSPEIPVKLYFAPLPLFSPEQT